MRCLVIGAGSKSFYRNMGNFEPRQKIIVGSASFRVPLDLRDAA
jgi:hypothetical protein